MRNNVIDLYNRIDEGIENITYLNFGYWKNARTVQAACEAMIDLVIDQAEIFNGCNILDVGFGYGTQDLYIHQRFPLSKIVGVNIVQKQIDYAIQKAKEKGLDDKIEYLNIDATELSFDANSFDRIIAVEAAFQFNTRAAFLKQAYDTLKENGVICLTDTTQKLQELQQYHNLDKTLASLGCPKENIMDEKMYYDTLQEVGFRSITFTDISEHVIPYIATLIYGQKNWRSTADVSLPQEGTLLTDYIAMFKENVLYHKYYIIKAVK
jgi:cyclopropane fatty-acyl-phospholipid synthase-like methyltransferase